METFRTLKGRLVLHKLENQGPGGAGVFLPLLCHWSSPAVLLSALIILDSRETDGPLHSLPLNRQQREQENNFKVCLLSDICGGF